jgi:Pyridoxamine 5'-phosphate oxidase
MLFSTIWGCALLADCAARLAGAYMLPVTTMVWLSTVMILGAVGVGTVAGGVAARPIQKMIDAAVTMPLPPGPAGTAGRRRRRSSWGPESLPAAYAAAMSAFTDAEIEFVTSQRLGRLATVGADGMPHVMPVAVFYDRPERHVTTRPLPGHVPGARAAPAASRAAVAPEPGGARLPLAAVCEPGRCRGSLRLRFACGRVAGVSADRGEPGFGVVELAGDHVWLFTHDRTACHSGPQLHRETPLEYRHCCQGERSTPCPPACHARRWRFNRGNPVHRRRDGLVGHRTLPS